MGYYLCTPRPWHCNRCGSTSAYKEPFECRGKWVDTVRSKAAKRAWKRRKAKGSKR